jgi:hypothetical protein
MGVLYDTLVGLAPEHDAEMLAGYQRYESLLEANLAPAQMDAYAAYLQQTDVIRIFAEMTPEELAALPAEISAIATVVMADTDLSMENRRVVALLNQRGEHDVAPDLGSPSES